MGKKAIKIDRWLDRNVLNFEGPVEQHTDQQRFVRDAAHFGMSLISEGQSALAAVPGYVSEWFKNGFYPEQMTFRKLPYLPERSDLGMLRKYNPDWIFRADFNPRRWVFVFLHGYIDNSGADRVAYKMAALGYQVYVVRYPFLKNIRRTAGELQDVLEMIYKREKGKRLVPIGHSLGGFIWDHLLLHKPELVERYQMPLYIPMGSPRFGTLAAHLGIGQSARQMQPDSDVVLQHLNRRFHKDLEIYPFVSRFDLLVLPIETALHRDGINYVFSETGHLAQVIRNEVVHAIEEVVASPCDVLKQRAMKRAFYLSSLTNGLKKLPKFIQRRLGIDGVLAYVTGKDNEPPPEFLLRIVHHELRIGLMPALARDPARMAAA